MNPTSFICERSSEYNLLPELIRVLKSRFEVVVPVYPWISREGSKLSMLVNKDFRFRVLGMYAMRPKVHSPLAPTMNIKFSEQIIYGSQQANRYGIPMIAGCPLARNFQELSSCEKYLWADMSKFTQEQVDMVAEVTIDGVLVNSEPTPFLHDEQEILNLIHEDNKEFTLSEFIEVIKKVKMASIGSSEYSPMAFMGGYKPVYLLLSNPT